MIADEDRGMRVMSWNVWWRFGDRWRERADLIVETLEEVRPDVVGLQEAWGAGDTDQGQWLGARLGMHAAFGAPSLPPPPRPPESRDQEGIAVGVAVLSRWPVIAVRRRPLPSRPEAPTEALVATLDHPEGPLHIVVACVDWERALHDLHLAQTRALAALVADPSLDGSLPVMLTADLNAPAASPQVEALTEVMTDAWVAAGHEPDEGHTLSSDNPLAPREAWQIDHRIDYVMARPGTPRERITVERVFLAGHRHDGLPPSDHSAVVADLRP